MHNERNEVNVILHADEQLQAFMHFFTHQLKAKLEKIMLTLDDILAKVADVDTAEGSVETLLVEIKAKLDAAIASGDPVKLQAVSDQLEAIKVRAGAAVVANTPADPANPTP